MSLCVQFAQFEFENYISPQNCRGNCLAPASRQKQYVTSEKNCRVYTSVPLHYANFSCIHLLIFIGGIEVLYLDTRNLFAVIYTITLQIASHAQYGSYKASSISNLMLMKVGKVLRKSKNKSSRPITRENSVA